MAPDRLTRIEDKLDLLINAVAAQGKDGAVHSAVCDSERRELREDVNSNTKKLWKLILVAAGAGGAGGGLLEAIKTFVG